MVARKKPCKNPTNNTCEDHPERVNPYHPNADDEGRAKIEIFGKAMVEKRVKACANSGRVYLPPGWVGRRVKIIRID